jgi:hypothetical protein
MNYFAVETKGWETDHLAVEFILRTAHELGVRVPKIEVLDRFKLGSTEFLRYRVQEDPAGLLDGLFAQKGRSVIGVEGSGYIARLKGGRTGSVNTATMLALPRSVMAYRGPGAQYWERQFEEPN